MHATLRFAFHLDRLGMLSKMGFIFYDFAEVTESAIGLGLRF